MNNCHLWILKIYQVDIRNIHYPWYIDGIRSIYAIIYAIVYYVFCTVIEYLQNVLVTYSLKALCKDCLPEDPIKAKV